MTGRWKSLHPEPDTVEAKEMSWPCAVHGLHAIYRTDAGEPFVLCDGLRVYSRKALQGKV